jgi:4-carboxymuconolactone decarboxylase
MPRIPDIVPDQLTPAQRAVHDRILTGPRGRVEGPLRVWLTSPELADRAQALGAFCRFGSSLPPRLSELGILVVGAYWRAKFEWYAHAPLGIAGGLEPAAVEAIRVGATPTFAKADERAVYTFARELVTARRVSDATYAMARQELGEVGVVDLVGILGYYGLVSMTLVTFEVPLPPGVADPFPDDLNASSAS